MIYGLLAICLLITAWIELRYYKRLEMWRMTIVFSLSWYALYWSVRELLKLPDSSIIWIEYVVAMAPAIFSVTWFIMHKIEIFWQCRWYIATALLIAICGYCLLFKSTPNEILFIVVVILGIVEKYHEEQTYVDRAFMGGLLWYQGIYSLSPFFPSPVWTSQNLQLIGLVPFLFIVITIIVIMTAELIRGKHAES